MAHLFKSGVHRVGSSRVLLVEDDNDAADLFATSLRRVGLAVSSVGDAEHALAIAPSLRPAVIVIDLGLPGLDGVALAECVSAMARDNRALARSTANRRRGWNRA